MLKITKHIVGTLDTNCHILEDKVYKSAIMIDPGEQSEDLTREVNLMLEDGVNFKYILLTHGHFDHISAVSYYKSIIHAPVVIGAGDKDFTNNNKLNLSVFFSNFKNFSADILIQDSEELEFASNKIKAYATPGHTIGSMCYLIENNLFSGDTLMKAAIGRTDLPTGDRGDLEESLHRLFRFNTNFTIYPGHGEKTDLFTEKAR